MTHGDDLGPFYMLLQYVSHKRFREKMDDVEADVEGLKDGLNDKVCVGR